MIAGILAALPKVAAAQQRATVPVVNHINEAWKPSVGRAASLDSVRDAIVRAAESLKWTVDSADPGALRASLVVRGKHTVRVQILWTTSVFSVRYDGSENMSYWQPSAGRDYIHPNYNVWTGQLVAAIRKELEQS